jgi:spore maturation protein CgeB
VNKLLLLADTSLQEAMGTKLLRAGLMLGIAKEWDVSVIYTSPAPNYSPSMKRKRGKIFYRLADKRSWEWWDFQKVLLTTIEELKPDLVVVSGILPLKDEIFAAIKRNGGSVVNYLTDDPWNPIHKRNCFLRNLIQYDHIFSTKDALQIRLRESGVKSTAWLPYAYDPFMHYPIQHTSGVDVLFVGTGAQERVKWLDALTNIPNIKRRIHGNSWDGIKTNGWDKRPAVMGHEYCKAISGARIVLGLLRESNNDRSTDRSYEIGAIGGCGLYQDTEEHRSILEGYPDEGFFCSPADLEDKAKKILNDKDLQIKLRSIGKLALDKKMHTYSARLESIINWVNT